MPTSPTPTCATTCGATRDEIPGNGIDDDGNGFVDDVNGADFVNRDGDPSDDNGHGTHVAGILAARGANRVGVTGVAQRARLMVLKALGADAVGSAETMAEAVRYAVANGAKIINMSVSGPGRSQAFEEAVQAASDAGVLMTVAAGNNGHDLDVMPEYPAAFPASHVIAVAATGRTGKLIGISNRGVGTVDIAAPGQGIVSTAEGRRLRDPHGHVDGLPARRRHARAAGLRPPRPRRRRAAGRAARLGQARRRRHDRHARRRGRDAPGGLRDPLAQRDPRELGPRRVEVQGQAAPAAAPAEPRGGAPGASRRYGAPGVDLTTFIFMMLVLKLPLGALLYIVWWAIKSTPEVEGSDEGGGAKRWPHGPRPPRTPHPPRRGPHAEPPPPSPARTRSVVAQGRDMQRS